MRRGCCVLLVAVLGGCSFVYDFGEFHPADAAVPVDAADSGELDAGLADAAVDAELDATVPITPEEFLERLRQRVCAKMLRCITKLPAAELLQVFCHAEVGTALLGEQLSVALDPGRFDPVVAERCLAALAGIDCSISGDFLAECDGALRGDLAPGAPCVSDYGCASDACVEQEAACGKICAMRGSIDVPCATNDDCNPQLRCREGACKVPGRVGDACDDTTDCEAQLWCPSTTGFCEVVPDDGQVCEPNFAGDPCRGSLVCTAGAAGAYACAGGGDLTAACDPQHPCRPGLRCSTTGTTANTCIVLSEPGGTCLSSQNCPVLHECVGELCVPRPMLGDACTPIMPCVRGACVAGSCSLQGPGAVCNDGISFFPNSCTGFCLDGGAIDTCADPLPLGARCSDDVECMIGAECLGPAASAVCTACTPP